MKRGIIQFTGGNKIRISRPGVDVDSASEGDFLLHEDFLFTQPYYSAFVACPFAGNTSNSILRQTVAVTVPNVTTNPIILTYPVSSESVNVFPTAKGYGTGSDAHGYTAEGWFISAYYVNATTINVQFIKSQRSLRSPLGCNLILMRRPS